MGIRKFYVDAPNKAFISCGFRVIRPICDWRKRGEFRLFRESSAGETCMANPVFVVDDGKRIAHDGANRYTGMKELQF
ncbi:hypothetical protein CVS37_02995 [Burkholderia lata]|nr:hypothetical protein CVS37_02995 [Burkholderia lata]